jgi:hypothetical protein
VADEKTIYTELALAGLLFVGHTKTGLRSGAVFVVRWRKSRDQGSPMGLKGR